MTITEIVATHQLDIKYEVAGLAHVLQMRCDGFGTGVGVNELIATTDLLVPVQDAADEVFTLMAPLYKAVQTSFLGWTLQEYIGGAYVPVNSGSTSVAATGSTNYFPGAQNTFTFRNSAFHINRFILFETSILQFDNFPYALLNASLQALVDSISGQASGDIGDWYEGRDGIRSPKNFGQLVIGPNKKLFRARGLR